MNEGYQLIIKFESSWRNEWPKGHKNAPNAKNVKMHFDPIVHDTHCGKRHDNLASLQSKLVKKQPMMD